MKIARKLVIVVCALLMTIALNAAENPTPNLMTLEDVAKYNGKNGQPAYLAVDNRVYDISNLNEWKNGTNKEIKAGRAVQKKSINPELIKNCPVVGRVIKVFTAEEVTRFNGQNGMPLYAIVNGLVYDNTPGKKTTGKVIGKIITPSN